MRRLPWSLRILWRLSQVFSFYVCTIYAFTKIVYAPILIVIVIPCYAWLTMVLNKYDSDDQDS